MRGAAAGGGALGALMIVAVSFCLANLWGAWGWLIAALLAAGAGALAGLAGIGWYRLAIVDPGTGLYNRRILFSRLAPLMARACRRQQPVAMVVIDVDDFRQYNNRHGHLVGDAVLRTVAATIRSAVRRGDLVARWGGEEFAILLPGAGIAEGLAVAERIRSLVAAQPLATAVGEQVRVTVSAGVAEAPPYGCDPLWLVDRADRAMYRAKEQKNMVVPA